MCTIWCLMNSRSYRQSVSVVMVEWILKVYIYFSNHRFKITFETKAQVKPELISSQATHIFLTKFKSKWIQAKKHAAQAKNTQATWSTPSNVIHTVSLENKFIHTFYYKIGDFKIYCKIERTCLKLSANCFWH